MERHPLDSLTPEQLKRDIEIAKLIDWFLVVAIICVVIAAVCAAASWNA